MEKKMNGMMDVKMNGKLDVKKGEGNMEEKKKEYVRKYACKCCGNYTLKRKGENDICDVCFWMDVEDDGSLWDKNTNANGISLNKARQNYRAFGACLQKYKMVVRDPAREEIPRWKR